MEVIIGILCFISFCVGIGVTFDASNRRYTNLYFENNRIGKLHVETSDPDGPLLFVELYRSIDFVKTKDFVVLEVDTENYVSHE